MRCLKRMADALTWLRLILAVAILVLAVLIGKAALVPALWLLLCAWVTDGFDGPLARRSGLIGTTWIGRLDPVIDIGLATADWVLLTASGFVPPSVAVLYLLLWCGIFWRHQGLRTTDPALYASLIYVWTIVVALQHDPTVGWALLLWPVASCAVGGKRFFEVRLPQFLRDLAELVRPQVGE